MTFKIRFKNISLFLLTFFVLTAVSSFCSTYFINGKTLRFKTETIKKYGTVFIPAKDLFKYTGLKFNFDKSSKTLFVNSEGNLIKAKAGEKFVYINKNKRPFSHTIIVKNEEPFVSAQFLNNIVGYRTVWRRYKDIVAIATSRVVEPIDYNDPEEEALKKEAERKDREKKRKFQKIEPLKGKIEGIKPIENMDKEKEG